MRRLWITVLVLLLGGCAGTPTSPDSPYFTVPAGSRLILEQPLVIPPERVSVYIQKGEVMRYGAVNRYYPHCKLELRERTAQAFTLQPDTFLVTRVSRNIWMVSRPSSVRLAGAAFSGVFGDDSSPMAAEMTTELFLGSDRQPQAYRMSCIYWDDPAFPEHLSINEIRATLAGLFRLELP